MEKESRSKKHLENSPQIKINYFIFEKKDRSNTNKVQEERIKTDQEKFEIDEPLATEVANIVDDIQVFSTRPTLRRGNSGQSVVALQTYLTQLGLFNTGINGQFGPITEQAVRTLQSNNNLTVDGIVGPRTWTVIENLIQQLPATGRPTLRRGSSGSNVTDLQRLLSRLGLFNVTPNGQFGPITEEAVRQFQRNNNLTVDGVVGPQTWNQIENAVANLPPSATGQRPTLRIGSSGLRVIELQLILQALGYFTGNPDGEFGNQTLTAVNNFQRAQGMTVDGVVGPQTWSRLDSSLSASGPEVVANRTTIRQGSRGSDVSTLQQILQVLGFFNGTPDGNFGPITREAVVNFQRSEGLASDGVVGRNTWNALYQAIAITPSEELPNLKQGATGEYVTILQEKLKLLGYFSGSVTGSFGSVTKEAVRQFQLNNNLVADGVVGSATWAKLFSATALPPPPVLTPGTARPTLRRGDSGDDVKYLQDELKTLMYYDGPINGIFDQKTEIAVKSFQDVNRLTPDGVVGRATWYSLYSLYPPKVTC